MAENLQYWDRIVAKARGSRVEHLSNEEVYRLGAGAVVAAVTVLESSTAATYRRPNELLPAMKASADGTLDATKVVGKADPTIGAVKLWFNPGGRVWATADAPTQEEGPISMVLKPTEAVSLVDAERAAVVANTAFALLEHFHGEINTSRYIETFFDPNPVVDPAKREALLRSAEAT